MSGKDNRILGTNTAASGATFTAIVRLFDQDRFDSIDTVDTKQTKIDALHAIRAAAIIDDRVPAATRAFACLGRLRRSGVSNWDDRSDLTVSVTIPIITVSVVAAFLDNAQAGCVGRMQISLHLIRLGRSADPAIQIDHLGARFSRDPFDFVDKSLSRIGTTQIDAIDFSIWLLALIDHPLLVIFSRLGIVVFIFFVLLFIVPFQQGLALLSAHV